MLKQEHTHRKPNLLDIGHCLTSFRVQSLQSIQFLVVLVLLPHGPFCSGIRSSFPTLQLVHAWIWWFVKACLSNGLRDRRLSSKSSFLSIRSVPKVGFELGTTLVQRDSMSKRPHYRVGGGEWQSFWDDSNGIDSVPNRSKLVRG